MTNEWPQISDYVVVIGSHIEHRDWNFAEYYVKRALEEFRGREEDSELRTIFYTAAAMAELTANEDLAKRCYAFVGVPKLPKVEAIPPEVLEVIIGRAIGYIRRLGADPTSRIGKIYGRILEMVTA